MLLYILKVYYCIAKSGLVNVVSIAHFYYYCQSLLSQNYKTVNWGVEFWYLTLLVPYSCLSQRFDILHPLFRGLGFFTKPVRTKYYLQEERSLQTHFFSVQFQKQIFNSKRPTFLLWLSVVKKPNGIHITAYFKCNCAHQSNGPVVRPQYLFQRFVS